MKRKRKNGRKEGRKEGKKEGRREGGKEGRWREQVFCMLCKKIDRWGKSPRF